jgi:hypothetical protein
MHLFSEYCPEADEVIAFVEEFDCFADAPTDDQHALAGTDGKRATKLLSAAQADGARVFAEACESAVTRMLASGDPLGAGVLFDEAELADIADALSRGIATADLMGRTRVRRRAEMAERRAEQFADTPELLTEAFAEADDDPFDVFDDAVPSMAPESAIAYFQRLVPTLGAAEIRYGPRLDRHAFTLAVASDQVLLDRVKAAILRELSEGKDSTPDVQDILDAAGVSERNPAYSSTIVRTNIMSALNEGQTAEIAEPEMQDAFPVYSYDGIDDQRAGDDHRPKFGRYYPSSVPFAEVRGPRAYNCRCGHSPIYKTMWAEMQRNGARVETEW